MHPGVQPAATSQHHAAVSIHAELRAVQEARVWLGLMEGQVGHQLAGAKVPQLQRRLIPPRPRQNCASAHVQRIAADVGPKDGSLRSAGAAVPYLYRVIPAARKQHVGVLRRPAQRVHRVAVPGVALGGDSAAAPRRHCGRYRLLALVVQAQVAVHAGRGKHRLGGAGGQRVDLVVCLFEHAHHPARGGVVVQNLVIPGNNEHVFGL
mmetsp:Transcript_21753/g.55792  ORF Transcript_21753/g.55792 Transcript_21753/m.55792 type:complete len:207 (-) Transcript_21753:624-1244(-)